MTNFLLIHLQLTFGKILDIPLIVTEQNPSKLGNTIKELDVTHATGIFDKSKFSMCIPEVQEVIEKLPNKIESVVIFGLESHICVEQTAMDFLASEKYSVHVVADCCLSRVAEDRAFALERLRSIGCFITTSENVIFKLMKDKNHPKFNDVRKLVTEPSTFPQLSNKL